MRYGGRVTTIDVTPMSSTKFLVTVADGRSTTQHEVTAEASDLPAAADGYDPSAVVSASFRFLLDRESKESILRRFRLSDIAQYFPDYPDAVAGYLSD
jgi:hypothetical protein